MSNVETQKPNEDVTMSTTVTINSVKVTREEFKTACDAAEKKVLADFERIGTKEGKRPDPILMLTILMANTMVITELRKELFKS